MESVTVGAGLELTEPVPIEDDFCSGLALIEDVGGCARFVLFSRQTVYETGGEVAVVTRKIVLQVDDILPALNLTVAFLARLSARMLREGWQRLMR